MDIVDGTTTIACSYVGTIVCSEGRASNDPTRFNKSTFHYDRAQLKSSQVKSSQVESSQAKPIKVKSS